MFRFCCRRGVAALGGGESRLSVCCSRVGADWREWGVVAAAQLSGGTRRSSTSKGSAVCERDKDDVMPASCERGRSRDAGGAPPESLTGGGGEGLSSGRAKKKGGRAAAALASVEVEELSRLFEKRLKQTLEEHKAAAAAPKAAPLAPEQPTAATAEAVEAEYPLPAREAMESFWWGFGVRDRPTLWSLVELGYKHDFLRDPVAVAERMSRMQEELPVGLAAVELVKGWHRVVLLDPNLLSRQLKYLAELLPGQDLSRMLLASPKLASTHPSRIMHNIQDLAAMLPLLDTFELLCREPGLLTADINSQVFDSAQGLQDILEGHCDPHAAIVAQPHLLLVPKSSLAKRWKQLWNAAAARETWQREMRWAANEPSMIAFFLSRNDNILERLDFLLEVDIGQHLPLALVLSLPTEEFSQRCESFHSWCFVRRHTRFGKAHAAHDNKGRHDTWREHSGGHKNLENHVNGAVYDDADTHNAQTDSSLESGKTT